jgi:hypothetical protein
MAAHNMSPTAMNVDATAQEQQAAIHGNEVLPIQRAHHVGHIHSRHCAGLPPRRPLHYPPATNPTVIDHILCASRMLASTLQTLR